MSVPNLCKIVPGLSPATSFLSLCKKCVCVCVCVFVCTITYICNRSLFAIFLNGAPSSISLRIMCVIVCVCGGVCARVCAHACLHASVPSQRNFMCESRLYERALFNHSAYLAPPLMPPPPHHTAPSLPPHATHPLPVPPFSLATVTPVVFP